jgi:large subunit ribosomal protein L5
MSRLKEMYRSDVTKILKEKFKYNNVNKLPKVEKIVVNCCNKECLTNSKMVDSIVSDLAKITGQKPVISRAKKSIAGFKLREGQALGANVTLRGDIMYEFLDRLINVTLPRVRDFRGISSKSFDGRGNYTLGLKEQIIFPEIEYDKIDKIRGLNIVIATTAQTNDEGYELLKELGMPFSTKRG